MFDETDDKTTDAPTIQVVAKPVLPTWKRPIRQPSCNEDLARNVTQLLLWCVPILGGASSINFVGTVISLHTKGFEPTLARVMPPRLLTSVQKNRTAVERLEAAAALAVRSFDSFCIFVGTQGGTHPFNFRLATEHASHHDYASSVQCAENAFSTFTYTQAKALEAMNKIPTVN